MQCLLAKRVADGKSSQRLLRRQTMNSSLMQTFSVAGMRLAGQRLRGLGVLCVAFLALALVLAPQAGAQDNATISGTVADNTGALLLNATIAITNIATTQTDRKS